LSGCPDSEVTIVDPADPSRRKTVGGLRHEDVLVPVLRAGEPVPGIIDQPLAAIRARTKAQLASLHPTIRRLVNPHAYPAGLEMGLHETRFRMMLEARGKGSANGGEQGLSAQSSRRSRGTDSRGTEEVRP